MARPTETTATSRRVLRELSSRGLLLQSDGRLASVAALVAGGPVRGSWWSHPKSNLIYWVLEDLEASGEVVRAKLVDGKQTLVHRSLWPALVAVATSGEPWQTRQLGAAARSLLERTRRNGAIRLDELAGWRSKVKPGDAARELERRLLVHADEVHTESGRHAKRLEDWSSLRKRVLDRDLPSPTEARQRLEAAIGDPRARFPWHAAAPLKRSR